MSDTIVPPGGGPLPDYAIEQLISITPFVKETVEKGVVSYGLSSYGYDCRVGYLFKIFHNAHGATIDPKRMDASAFITRDLSPNGRDEQGRCVHCGTLRWHTAGFCEYADNFVLIPPHSFALAETIETFEIPSDVIALCSGKSTYARCGLIIPVTPLEPGWRGKVTVEIANITPLPAKVYVGEGIMQVVFFRGVDRCHLDYAQKGGGGKYQDQPGLTMPFVK